MQHDGWFFAGIFVFIFLVWFAVGGPHHPISFTGPTLKQPGVLGGGTYLSLPSFNASGIGSVSLPGSSSGSSGSLLSGVPYGASSPHGVTVSMQHHVVDAGQSPQKERIELSLSSTATTSVDITGWTIESAASGNAEVIPQGTAVPSSGTINPVQDIVLKPGDRAYLISGQSPIGSSFRTNICTGYFGNYQTFNPSLPNTCPTPSDELHTHYPDYIRDSACISYVNNIRTCQVVLTPPVNLTSACQTFLTNYLNYNGCVQAHQNSANFAGRTWYIYLGRNVPMWRTKNEVVKLLDKNGKTVDAFDY